VFPQNLLANLMSGLLMTLLVTAGGIALCLAMAFIAGLAKTSKVPPLRWLAHGYIELFRGTSALVQLFWFVYVLPRLGVPIEPITAGIVALGLNYGAYAAEIVRSSIQNIDRGQYEAALALNFTPMQTMWRIIIPQSVVSMIPPMGNIFIELLKNSALVSFISVYDLTLQARINLNTYPNYVTSTWVMVLLMYFAVAMLLTLGMRGLEKAFSRWRPAGGFR
jgi:polar amino acid transport system permease protein